MQGQRCALSHNPVVQRQEVSCPIRFPAKSPYCHVLVKSPNLNPVLFCFLSFPLLCFRLLFLGDPNIEVLDHGQVLKIKSARLGDQARYQCSVTNSAGKQSRDFNLSVYGVSLSLSVTTPRFYLTSSVLSL